VQGEAAAHGAQRYLLSRTAVEARLRFALAAMPPERYAACFRALSEGVLCHMDAGTLKDGGSSQNPGELVDYGYFLATIVLLVDAPASVCALPVYPVTSFVHENRVAHEMFRHAS
jgi:hypothetical protein